MAVLAAVVGFAHLLAGFTNRQLTDLVSTLLDGPYTSRQATYDLRRLKRKRLIERLPHTNRYQLTPLGRRVAVLFTKAHGRVLAPALAWLEPSLPDDIARRSPLAQAWRRFDHALDDFIADQLVAA
jgi:predicted MarR family transcription regulator